MAHAWDVPDRAGYKRRMSDLEVPQPDAVEQAQPVAETAARVAPSDDPEAPEADALEQAMEEPMGDDELRG